MTDKTQPPLFDAWDVDDPKTYSIDKIYTEAIDKKHNAGEAVRAKVRSSHVEMMAMIVAKNWVPEYNTVQDFIRDAIYHRMHFWSERITDGELRRVVTEEGTRLALERFERQMIEGEELVTSSKRVLERAAKVRDIQILESTLTEIGERLETARTPYLEDLQKLYREYGRKCQELVEERRVANGDS